MLSGAKHLAFEAIAKTTFLGCASEGHFDTNLHASGI
jgi:hypothetical protein